MKALLQRVTKAQVEINGNTVGSIQHGLLILLGISPTDSEQVARKLAARVAGYRMFSDAEDKMNLSLSDDNGEALVVSQFTLAADTNSGRRPSFSSAAPPAQAEPLYLAFVEELKALGISVATGEFGADMQVSLTNDGPVTFLLDTEKS
ncbi:D-tyrosyl-tRNA(Tyr) deacylase [Pseudidiomarina sp. 1APP75-32.1]|uniref:D-aminoacyl-tRNA deacylase n=1 Tax=Pseudidiomarina terrestris TaxID=2820060 RepID=A0AAW7R2S7_9GAMM|nr:MULTISPECIES: D-aminoacyl-tRNA deacylase [unclassified Pseudidiomarina]MDN7124819.1 D-tyrosyl-tRNA(Tyr) deacylase [Pseudidiomarina sp. 1APP75-32.1]MDN7129707.1 D-tyrosyl-tRNA(Tyr) deacylase [Pseudidiomarina sp. 1APR75-15]MEA3588194.1 D-tyrosyl-tRNA(Tyr) deacylase [Pseudidiomarina sp. 1APP75-27a]